MRNLLRCLPFTLPLLLVTLACGGGQSAMQVAPPQPQPKAMSADEARGATWGFLTVEHGATLASQMPGFVPGFTTSGDAKFLSLPTLPPCVTVTTTTGPGLVIVALTFNGCGGPEGGTLNGSVTISIDAQATNFTVAYQNLVATKDSRTWTFKGSKGIKLNQAAKQAVLTATSLSATFTDSAHPDTNRAYLYNADLLADWATTGAYKLSGTFSLQTNADTVIGAIQAASPLTWTQGCCYPTSGAIAYTRNAATTTATFGLPCGTLTLTPAGQAPQTQVLSACGTK